MDLENPESDTRQHSDYDHCQQLNEESEQTVICFYIDLYGRL